MQLRSRPFINIKIGLSWGADIDKAKRALVTSGCYDIRDHTHTSLADKNTHTWYHLVSSAHGENSTIPNYVTLIVVAPISVDFFLRNGQQGITIPLH